MNVYIYIYIFTHMWDTYNSGVPFPYSEPSTFFGHPISGSCKINLFEPHTQFLNAFKHPGPPTFSPFANHELRRFSPVSPFCSPSCSGFPLVSPLRGALGEPGQENKHVIFTGNGYSAEWPIEASKRGLPNLNTTPKAVATWSSDKNKKPLGSSKRREGRGVLVASMWSERLFFFSFFF